MKKTNRFIFVFLLSICLFYQANAQAPSAISREVILDLLESTCPDDDEIKVLLKDKTIQYDPSLANTNFINSDSEEINAWYLGVHSSDLLYSYIFDKKEDVKKHTSHLENISKKLGFENIIGFPKLRQHLSSGNYSSIKPINKIGKDAILKVNEKKQLLALFIATGAWIENLYINISTLKNAPNEMLKNKIGKQEIILDQLKLLLSFHDNNPSAKNLLAKLQKLRKVYKKMDIKITYLEPVEKYDDNGVLIYEDNTKVEINNYSTETLDKLYEVVKAIRKNK